MQKDNFDIKAFKEKIDLVDYLASLGYQTAKQYRHDYWFLSPLHEERTASFKIDRSRQIWYDHGTGEGGDLISFIQAYCHCDFKESIVKLQEYLNIRQPEPGEKQAQNISVREHINPSPGKKNHIQILAVRSIEKPYLKQYIQSRGISFSLASVYLKEVDYNLYSKTYTALGFRNDAGGYELRNQYFKGSSAPKAPKIILLNDERKPLQKQTLAVFEGFFSMLSFLELVQKDRLSAGRPDHILVLNSLSLMNKSQDIITAYGHTDLYLDNDLAGQKATFEALARSENIRDRRVLYEGFNDLNTYLCQQKTQQNEEYEPAKSLGMRH